MWTELPISAKNQRLIDALNKRYVGKIVKVRYFYTFEKADIYRIKYESHINESIIFRMRGSEKTDHFDYWFLDFQREVQNYYNIMTEVSRWHIWNRRIVKNGGPMFY
jgi:hypothetical protein